MIAALRSRLRRAALLTGILSAGSLAVAACSKTPAEPAADGPWFASRLEGSGIDFVNRPGHSGRKYFIEINLGGVSLLDADGDGRLDVYFCQGEPLPGYTGPPDGPFLDRLYRNEGGWKFRDVTAPSGAGQDGYTFSASAPDWDGDGDVDLYLCEYGPNRLLQNDGSGRFQPVEGAAGAADPSWSSCACFADLDRDGDLDLYVANYVIFDLEDPHWCGEKDKGEAYRAYCHPDEFVGQPDRLYRLDDDGGRLRYTDVSAEAGLLTDEPGKGLAIVPVDDDNDGDVDLYVANDAVPNFLWRNLGGMRFRNVAYELGCAQDAHGRSQSCMGSDAADVDGDGDFDLFSANMANETNVLYVNDGDLFVDDTAISGLAQDSLLWVGFGAELFDADLDGDPDLLIANGHVLDNVELYDPYQKLRQPAQLYECIGPAKFRHVDSRRTGPYFLEPHIGRGLAAGDLDDDGDVDAVIANNREAPMLLENRRIHAGRRARWIAFQLIDQTARNHQALGARLTVTAGGITQIEEIRGISSYAAWIDTRAVFGLGDAENVEQATVRWPDGEVSALGPLKGGRFWRVERDPSGPPKLTAVAPRRK